MHHASSWTGSEHNCVKEKLELEKCVQWELMSFQATCIEVQQEVTILLCSVPVISCVPSEAALGYRTDGTHDHPHTLETSEGLPSCRRLGVCLTGTEFGRVVSRKRKKVFTGRTDHRRDRLPTSSLAASVWAEQGCQGVLDEKGEI